MSDSLQPHGLQHAKLPCPSPSPGASSNSWALSQWCHPIILSSVVPFSSYIQSFLASWSLLMNLLFTSGGQSIGASVSLLLMNIQHWFPLGLTGLISLQSKGLSRVFSNSTVQKHEFFSAQPSLWSNSHIHTWLLENLLYSYSQFSSVTQLCLTLCDPMDCRTPGIPVHHQPPEFTQTHVHQVGDVIQSSHPLLSPFPPTFNLSQHQGLFR